MKDSGYANDTYASRVSDFKVNWWFYKIKSFKIRSTLTVFLCVVFRKFLFLKLLVRISGYIFKTFIWNSQVLHVRNLSVAFRAKKIVKFKKNSKVLFSPRVSSFTITKFEIQYLAHIFDCLFLFQCMLEAFLSFSKGNKFLGSWKCWKKLLLFELLFLWFSRDDHFKSLHRLHF